MKVGAFAAGLCCVIAAYAAAQRVEQAPRQDQAPGQPRAGQADRPATQQRQPYTAQFRGTQATAGQNQEVERYLATCLTIKNQAEIDANEFAQQRAQNPEVKQFAQQMVQDHQQLAQKLQQLPSFQVAALRSAQRPGADGQFDAQRQPTDTARTPGTQPAPGANRLENQAVTADRPAGQNWALHNLLQIDRQITDRCMQMVREELESKSGPEFDKCYLGSQIGNHVQMLAALEVIEQQAQGELRQAAQEAKPIVQQHLEHAKQLAKQLEGTSRTGAQAERQAPTRTQR
jgi:predicted outer membrane protein